MSTITKALSNRTKDGATKLMFAGLFEELQFLRTSYAPYLQSLYLQKLGGAELEQKTARFKVSYLRRKSALIQSALNTNCMPDVSLIDELLKKEFALWESQILRFADEMEEAAKPASYLNAEDAQELRKLFRNLTTILHPALRESDNEFAELLWLQVSNAYSKGYNEELRRIDIFLNTPDGRNIISENATTIEIDMDKIRSLIAGLKSEITDLRSKFPFTIEKQLNDEAWILAQKACINREKEEDLQKEQLLIQHINQQISSLSYGD